MSNKPTSRTRLRPEIVGLSRDRLEGFQKKVGYSGAWNDRQFFEKFVWWWKPLVDILDKWDRKTGIPDTQTRGFFPPEMFEMIRFFEEMHDVPALIDEWIAMEFGARLKGSFVREWPPLIPSWDWKLLSSVNWARRYVVEEKLIIDLRKPDSEHIADFKARLKRRRKDIAPRNPFPGIGQRPKRNSTIKTASFGILEKIDARYSLGDTHIDHDHLANARILLAKKEDFIRLWFIPKNVNAP